MSNKAKDAAGDLPATAQKGVKDVKDTVQEDLKALQDKMKKMGGEGPKSKGSQDSKGKAEAPKRSESPKKSDPSKRSESPKKMQNGGGGSKRSESPKKGQSEKKEVDGDARAYEVVPDEPKTEEEKKAEEEMQPKLG